MFFCSCHFANGVQEETQRSIIAHKIFIHTLSFRGKIIGREHCDNCKLNKYKIIISLKEIIPKNITIDNQSFQPFYFFETNDSLTISVAKNLYEIAQEGLSVEKDADTDYLTVGPQKYRLISEEKYKWLSN